MPERAGVTTLLAELSRFVRDRRVLAAIEAVPRERFLPHDLREHAYENVALPIGQGQTISQPLVVARMLELLRLDGSERVLDVGTGSGYHAALLGQLAHEVVSVERHRCLSDGAARALEAVGASNVELWVGDGSRGVPERAPYDAVNVAAAVSGPLPPAVVAQLAARGRLVAPVAADPARPDDQRLIVLRRAADGTLSEVPWEAVRFVPLVLDEPE